MLSEKKTVTVGQATPMNSEVTMKKADKNSEQSANVEKFLASSGDLSEFVGSSIKIVAPWLAAVIISLSSGTALTRGPLK